MNSFLEVSIPMDYKNTIITPKTDFPMKAGLPTREPGMLSRWEEQDLYEAMLKRTRISPPLCSTTALPSATATSTWVTP